MPGPRKHSPARSQLAYGTLFGLALLWAPVWGCGTPTCGAKQVEPTAEESIHASSCLEAEQPSAIAPHVEPAMEFAAYWLNRMPTQQRSRILLDASALPQPRATARLDPTSRVDQDWPDSSQIAADGRRAIDERTRYYAGRFAQPTLFTKASDSWQKAQAIVARSTSKFDKRGLLRDAALRCTPCAAGFFDNPQNTGFDRNQCSVLYAGTWVFELARDEESGWSYVAADQGFGWVERDSLGGVVARESSWNSNDFIYATRDQPNGAIVVDPASKKPLGALRMGTRIPRLAAASSQPPWHVVWPSKSGWQDAQVTAAGSNPPAIAEKPLSLTYETLFQLAFAQIGEPYAWGGAVSRGRDCSRFILDVLAPFGLEFPRNSAEQSWAGNSTIEVESLSDTDKRQLIRKLARDHVVILYMPGHIMLYLGSATDSTSGLERDYAISAISEYLEPCSSGAFLEQTLKLDRTAVTTLDLGRNTSRRAFIERITRLAVLGSPVP